MSLLNDKQIHELCMAGNPLISPFTSSQVTKSKVNTRTVSSGLSSVGYDIRIDRTIRTFRNPDFFKGEYIDPKNFNDDLLTTQVVPDEKDFFTLPAHGYCLANSMEEFDLPATVAALCVTKSTYARSGVLVNVTPLEPGWKGYLTLEIANLTGIPVKIYVGEGIAQILFFEVQEPNVSYSARKGKYQNQSREPVSPRMVKI